MSDLILERSRQFPLCFDVNSGARNGSTVFALQPLYISCVASKELDKSESTSSVVCKRKMRADNRSNPYGQSAEVSVPLNKGNAVATGEDDEIDFSVSGRKLNIKEFLADAMRRVRWQQVQRGSLLPLPFTSYAPLKQIDRKEENLSLEGLGNADKNPSETESNLKSPYLQVSGMGTNFEINKIVRKRQTNVAESSDSVQEPPHKKVLLKMVRNPFFGVRKSSDLSGVASHNMNSSSNISRNVIGANGSLRIGEDNTSSAVERGKKCSLATTTLARKEQGDTGVVGKEGVSTEDTVQRRQEACLAFSHDLQIKGTPGASSASSHVGSDTAPLSHFVLNDTNGKEVNVSARNSHQNSKNTEQTGNQFSPLISSAPLTVNTSFISSFRLSNKKTTVGNLSTSALAHRSTSPNEVDVTSNSRSETLLLRPSSITDKRKRSVDSSDDIGKVTPAGPTNIAKGMTPSASSLFTSSFSGSIRPHTLKTDFLNSCREAVAAVLAESSSSNLNDSISSNESNPIQDNHLTNASQYPPINKESSGRSRIGSETLPTNTSNPSSTASTLKAAQQHNSKEVRNDSNSGSTHSPTSLTSISASPKPFSEQDMNVLGSDSGISPRTQANQSNSSYTSSAPSASSASHMPVIYKGNGGYPQSSHNPGNSDNGGGNGGYGNDHYDFRVMLSSGKASAKPIELSIGAGWTQGMRPTMEDEHFCKLHGKVVREQSVSFLGILDGHCGKRVADLGAKVLPEMFFSHEAIGENNALAMVECILQADHSIYHTLSGKPDRGNGRYGPFTGGRTSSSAYGGHYSHFSESAPSGGSTLICAAVHGRMLYVACLGDARAVVLDGKITIPMSEDHKPQNTKEIQRIQRCGGFVQFGRVCGVLAVSRALGDFEFKSAPTGGHDYSGLNPIRGSSPGRNALPYGRESGPNSPHNSFSSAELMVSNVADVRQMALTDDSKFLILACDGLWDVVSNEEATQFVQDFLTYTPEVNDVLVLSGKRPKPSSSVVHRVLCNCSQKLAEFAVDRGSTDNVSVMVLFFHDVVETVVGFSHMYPQNLSFPSSVDSLSPYSSPSLQRRKKKNAKEELESVYSSTSSLFAPSTPLQGVLGRIPAHPPLPSDFSLPPPPHPTTRRFTGNDGHAMDMRNVMPYPPQNSAYISNASVGNNSSGGRGWLPSPQPLRNSSSSVAELGVAPMGSGTNNPRTTKGAFPTAYGSRARSMR